jgi:hypothetical protein
MKKIIFLIIFGYSFCYSQHDTLSINLKYSSFDEEISFEPFEWKASFTNQKSNLTIYNSTTSNNNTYTNVGGNYFLSNIKSFSTINILELNRINSFNPNGSNDFGNALIFGVLNLIFKKN